MNSIFFEYFKEKGVSDIVAQKLVEKISRYEDIAEEFQISISKKAFPQENAIRVQGYSAADISGMAPHMDIGGVYNFLVLLREDPKKAEKYIMDNFPRK